MLEYQVSKKAPRKHYPAPYALVDLWVRHGGDKQAMLVAEARSVARLINGKTASNLIRAFNLQGQMKKLGRQTDEQSRHIHVIGAGTMGGDIAAWCALKGYRVSLQDQEAERIAPAIKRARDLYRKKLRDPRLVRAAMDRLIPDVRGDGLAGADVVIEAVFEDLDVKRGLFRKIEPRMKADALLATNTSSLPLDELEQALEHPQRLVALHFFNPVSLMQLVEVSSGQSANEDTRMRATALVGKLSKLPVIVSSRPGFLVNRILMPYMLEAVLLYQEGVNRNMIDAEARRFGMPMGPLELADTVGLDVCLSVAGILSDRLGMEVPAKLQQMVDDGLTGKKSGKGFYEYRKGKPVVGKSSQASGQVKDVEDRLILRLLNESARCLSEGVVEHEDMLDAAIIFGTGFAPFTGGPVHYMKSLGVDIIADKLDGLASQYGPRFNKDDWFDQQE
jgi:3-hydroxyacyl-CoA dehydrogenase/enoyl-CoA hydratase/3-hydroxybutyryl-CoA epimerase